jgi:hypothetical protein
MAPHSFRLAMVQVESEAIEEIGYDAGRSILFVRFAHGGRYRYFEVPHEVCEAFVSADSHGRYFHEHIRDRYRYRRDRRA